jgi:ferric-dicitrate binding protein FerR (iron transport regulator)
MMDDELRDWIDKSLNDTATEEELRALEKRLLSDEQARDCYLNAVNIHASLRRRFSVAEEPPSVTPFPTLARRKFGVGLAIAASVAVIIGISSLFLNTSSPTAVIAHVVGAYGEAGNAYTVGETVKPGPVIVSRGLVRLDFSNGARVTIEGPAQVEVINKMRMVLHRGVVTATIPESAVGFVVDTSAAHVVDLGTSFGVSVSEAGLTEVCVFDGEVEVSPPKTARPNAAPRLVKEGQAIRASKDSDTIDSVAYETSRFENAWPVNSGVLQTTGSMRFVSPGPDFHPGNFEDNEHIVVFPERRGFDSDETIRVDLVDPGEYAKSRYRDKPTLSPGRRLTSYLLQLDAFPEGKKPNRRRSVRGQITFATPIVGVITVDRLLKESEAVFGIPDVDYPTPRTIEPRPEGDPRPGFDTLILAADRRTLLIELQVSPGKLDQVRVLVEAEQETARK